MRKMSLILTVLLMLSAPAWAKVDILCDTDGNVVTIAYNAVTEPNLVRAFALNITVNKGIITVITGVDANVNYDYIIYPSSITIENGVITDWGTPVADACDLPGDTKPGLGTNEITIEMGALYAPPTDDSPNVPPPSGTLLKLIISDPTTCVTITENQGRGGVVLTDPTPEPDVNAPGCSAPPDCFYVGLVDKCGTTITQSMVDRWVAKGMPESWCWPCHCRGDTNNDGLISTTDLRSPDGPGGANHNGWLDAWTYNHTEYQPTCDTNYDGLIGTTDLRGSDGPGGTKTDGWIDGWNRKCN